MKRQFTNNALTGCWSKYIKFWMAIPLISWMTFSIWILATSKISMLLLLKLLEIIACSTPSVIGQIDMETLAFWLEKLMLSRIIQKRIKKLALHWMPMSNLLKGYSWCWIHLIVHTGILFCQRILLAFFSFFGSRRYCKFSTLNK